MEIQRLFFFSSYFFLLSLVIGNQCVGGSSDDLLLLGRRCKVDGFQPKKLFVFGDSYADTGNTNKSTSSAWKFPYGITFPGRPGGRFSSGHIFPEYLAKCLGLTVSPIPYEQRKIVPTKRWQYGMNFAYGGSGVFETLVSYPNMSRQIDLFQDLIDEGTVYKKSDLNSSMALVTIFGNDYNAYLANHDLILGLPFFIIEVVDQLAKNLKRIHEMGMKKIAVAAIQPLGCLPGRTAASSYEKCSALQNLGAVFHNALLEGHVLKLNNDAKDSSAFVILDLYDAFSSVINSNGDSQGSVKFETPLKPCCMGVNSSYSCGEMEDKEKMYTLCENPEAAFFWDDFHPTQAGWGAVFSALYPTLQQIS